MTKQQNCVQTKLSAKLQNKAAIRGAIDSSWTLHKTRILQLQTEKLVEQTKQLYSDQVAHSHELTVVTSDVERMLQAYTLVNLMYTKIESAGSVSEKVTLEKQIESDISELKKAHAALIKAMKHKTKILEAEEMDKAMQVESRCSTER